MDRWWHYIPGARWLARTLGGRGHGALVPSRHRGAGTPQALLPPSWRGQPKWKPWQARLDYDKAFTSSSWVSICARKNAHAVSQARWRLERRVGADRWEPDPSHPFNRLLRRPNQAWSLRTFLKRMSLDSMLHGNILLDQTRNNAGDLVELWPIPPALTEPVPASEGPGLIAYYEYTGDDGMMTRIPAEDVVHLQEMPDPRNIYWGLSRMGAALKPVQTDDSAADYQKCGLDNRGIPPLVVQLKQPNGSPVPDEKAKAYKAAWQKMYEGAKNAGKAAFTGVDVTVTKVGATAEDIGFKDGRSMTREEIAAHFEIPLPLVGVLQQATYSNAREVRRFWWETTVAGMCGFLAEELTEQLLWPTYGDDDIRLAFSLDHIPALSPAFTERLDQAERLQRLGWSPEEIDARLRLGRPRLGTDTARRGHLRSIP